MKTICASIVLLLLVTFLPAGDAPSNEGVVKQMLAIQGKITETLATVKDQATADAAKPELRKSTKEWLAVRAQAEKLPPPSRDEKNRLEKEYKEKLEAARKKLAAEVLRVQVVPGGPDALKEIRGVLDKQMK